MGCLLSWRRRSLNGLMNKMDTELNFQQRFIVQCLAKWPQLHGCHLSHLVCRAPKSRERDFDVRVFDDRGRFCLVEYACRSFSLTLRRSERLAPLRAVTGFKHNDIILSPSRSHTRHQVCQPSFGRFYSYSLIHTFNAYSRLKMTSEAPRTVAGVNVERDFGYGISTKPAKPPSGEAQPGQSKASRALTLASYFVGGCMA